MNRRNLLLSAAALAAGAASCSPGANGAANAQASAPFPMRRGVNLGNALEAPNEGDWGYRIEAEHLQAITAAGFDGVRLPVRWDAHAAMAFPYAIDPRFLARVDAVVGHALEAGLRVQLDLHHYDALVEGGMRSPHRGRFLGIWGQLAQHYRERPAALMFEPFNEPNGRLWDNAALQALQRQVLDVIRARDPERLVVFGPGNWQNIDALRDWRPPEDHFGAGKIAVSVHYYEPHAFTHEGAEWMGADAPRFARAWGTEADRALVREHVGAAANWARQHGYAMQLGEFGVNRAVPVAQRAAWTGAVREACEAEGMGWCAWDFAGAFPVWDREQGAWIEPIRAALLD
jgi:endoglucanase